MASLKNIFYGTLMAGLGMTNLSACSQKDKEPKDGEKSRTELTVSDFNSVSEYNAALFENCRSDMKFALAFVENYYRYVYNDRPDYKGKWTTASGLTVLYSDDGRHCQMVTPNTKVPTIEENSRYKDNYLTYDVWLGCDTNGKKLGYGFEDIIKVPLDRNTLVAACILRYCVGGPEFKKSKFLEYLNNGKSGKELAKTLTGYRQQKGVLNRCYFFAAILADKMQYSDLLDLRAEGCYNFNWCETVVIKKDKNGNRIKKKNPKTGRLEYVPKTDGNGFCEWVFSDLDSKLKQAKAKGNTTLYIKGGETVTVPRQLVKDIVPDYVWAEVSDPSGKTLVKKPTYQVGAKDLTANNMNDSSWIAYQSGDYNNALRTGRVALDMAGDDKQRGAATFNIGITYSATGNYDSAVHYLEQSLAYNERPSTRDSLAVAKQNLAEQVATQKRNAKRNGVAGVFVAGMGAAAAIALKRRKKLIQTYQRVK